MVLRDIQPEVSRLMARYNSDECEDSEREEIEQQLEALDLTLETKASNYAELIGHYQAQAAQIKEEEQRLATLRKRAEHSAAWLHTNIAVALQVSGKDKLETEFHKFSFRSSKSVSIRDGAQIPEEYCTVKIEPSKTKLKEALEQGIEIDGACIETKRSLQIK